MNRTVIFAHYDKNNKILDYVIYYLKELKKVADNIIFVSDCNLPKEELDKLQDIVTKSIAYKHGEYDFGSYKRGYFYFKEKCFNNGDELIFANDSCFGPFVPLNEIFKTMQDKNCDFWGTNKNNYPNAHIQSFFIVFKKNVFESEVFDNFMSNITQEKNKSDIITKYEIGLSQLLLNSDFLMGAYTKQIESNIMDSYYYETPIIFLKKSVVYKINNFILKVMLKLLFKKHKINYPIEYILASLKGYSKDFSYSFKQLKRPFLRIHFKERKIFCMGKWYNY